MADVTKTGQVIISGKDDLSPAMKTAAASTAATETQVKSFGQTLADLKPKGETIGVVMQGLAVATGAVAGAFAAAATQSVALQGQLGSVADAGRGTLRSLGDAIAASESFQRAVGSAAQGLGELGGLISQNAGLINQLVRDGLKPLASVASLAVISISGLAQAVLVLQNVSAGYIQMVKGFAQTAVSPLSAAVGLGNGPQDMVSGARSIWAGLQSADSSTARIAGLEAKMLEALDRFGRGETTGSAGMVFSEAQSQGITGAFGRRQATGGRAAAPRASDPFRVTSEGWDSDTLYAGAAPQTNPMRAAADAAKSARFGSVFGASSNAIPEIEQATSEFRIAASSAATDLLQVGSAALMAGAGLDGFIRSLASSLGSSASNAGASAMAGGLASGNWLGAGLGALGILGGGLLSMFGMGGGSERSYTEQQPMPVAIVEDRRPKAPIVVYLSMPSGSTYGQRTLTAQTMAEAY